MIGDSAQKEIFERDYRRHRKLGAKLKDREDYDGAARHYHRSAKILEEIADLERSDSVARKRRAKAEKLREAAEKLRRVASGEAAFESEVESDGNVDDGLDRERSSSPNESEGGDEVDATRYLEDPPEVDFSDVGGMETLVQTLRDKVLDPLERRDLYEEYDLGVVNGVLLYGPPGTGKTYVTRALAGEAGFQFVDVDASDVVSSLVGEGAQNVAEVFEVARENQPCLVFLDEIDALAADRSGGSQKTQSQRQMITQLLTDLSEIRDEDVVVVAATNVPGEIDPAAWSRFQERIEVPPPDPPAREAILRVHLRDRPVVHGELDWEYIREATADYTARDLKTVANEAARGALTEARETGEIQEIRQGHVEDAIDDVDPSLENFDGFDLPE